MAGHLGVFFLRRRYGGNPFVLPGFGRLPTFAKASRLRIRLRPGKRPGRCVTEKNYYKYFLLFLDTHYSVFFERSVVWFTKR